MFTQHRMAFLADTKSYLGKSEQHDNDTKLVLAIGTSHFGREGLVLQIPIPYSRLRGFQSSLLTDSLPLRSE